MLLRNTSGAFELYDISNNAITSTASLGTVGPEWQVAGFGDFSGKANETDMMMRATSGVDAGEFLLYDISNNKITPAAGYPVGVNYLTGGASDWTVAGFGHFDGNANESDMLMRSTSGAFAVYTISSNVINPTPISIGTVGPEWTVAGFGNFSGNANEQQLNAPMIGFILSAQSTAAAATRIV
jgi:hypothetical protein